MSWLSTLRKLVLGETWVLPISVAVVIACAFLLRELVPDIWADVGGPLLLLGVVGALVLSVGRAR